MTEIGNIVEQLQRSIEADPWHGPSLLQVLEGVSAETAAAHPIAGAHSMWELLLHVIAWTRAVNTRMQGRPVELDGDANFPPVQDCSERAWAAAKADLMQAHKELYATLESVSDADLAGAVPGRPYNRAFLLHGLPQHHAYHSGQMALLRKAAEAGKREGAARS